MILFLTPIPGEMIQFDYFLRCWELSTYHPIETWYSKLVDAIVDEINEIMAELRGQCEASTSIT